MHAIHNRRIIMKKYKYKVIEVQNSGKLIQDVLDIWGLIGFRLTNTITETGYVKLIFEQEDDE